LPAGGAVRKRRHLFLYRHTRIHLDEVEGLGPFVELETVMCGQPESEAHAELQHVAAALALKPDDAVPRPYVELLPRPA
jgi:predicted adenylyl cyclase CyaB